MREAIDILHRDDELVAVMKPAGLAVHRGWAAAPRYALDLVRDRVGARVYPVHRLDQPTSGVLVFALSSEAARALCDAFASQRVHKRYLALVRGVPPATTLTIDSPVKDARGVRVPATTHVAVRWVFRRRYALVEARPETGRTHQIRRHLKHISCPVIGDTSYGKSEHNRLFRDEFGLGRLALHALELTLPHPKDGAPLTIRAPLPPDLAEPLARIGCPPELLVADAALRMTPTPIT